MPFRANRPCSGGCGRVLWHGTGSTIHKCLECRRANPTLPPEHICVNCEVVFNAYGKNRKFCSRDCVHAYRRKTSGTMRSPARNRRSEESQRYNKLYGGRWQRTRKIVLAGQPIFCHICKGERGPIRYDLKYPHPLSPSVDHIIPIWTYRHLSDDELYEVFYDLKNLAPCHFGCNGAKQNEMSESSQLQCNPGQEW